MRSETREYLRSRRAENFDEKYSEFFEGTDTSSESDRQRQRLETLRAYDPEASLPEGLQLRLIGDRQHGAVGEGEAALIKPLNESLIALADSKDVGVELVGVGQGSTVMELRPVQRGRHEIDGRPIDATKTDAAMRKLLELLAAFENGSKEPRYKAGWLGASGFVSRLDELQANAELRWEGPDGGCRCTALTERARTYVREQRETFNADEVISVTGRVVMLKDNGEVKVKTGTSRTSKAYLVHFSEEVREHMPRVLGDSVSLRIRQSVAKDGFDAVKSERFFFVADLLGGNNILPLELPWEE